MRHIRLGSCLVVLSLICVSLAPTGVIAQAASVTESLQISPGEAAFNALEQAAEKGDPQAQFALSFWLQAGRSGAREWVLSGEWLKKAADQGYEPARHTLGVLYGVGNRPTKQAFSQARQVYEAGALGGDEDTQLMLGLIDLVGFRGGYGDWFQTEKWLEKSAEQGHVLAQYVLGDFYKGATMTQQDHALAVKWMTKAAEQGSSDAQHALGNMYAGGDGVPQDYVKARYWLEKAALQGNRVSQLGMGRFYENALGGKRDYGKARYWLEKSANQGERRAQFHLGVLYERGLGGSKDYVAARRWFVEAAKQGDIVSVFALGRLYETGRGVRQDKSIAKQYYGLICDERSQVGCEDYRRLNELGY